MGEDYFEGCCVAARDSRGSLFRGESAVSGGCSFCEEFRYDANSLLALGF